MSTPRPAAAAACEAHPLGLRVRSRGTYRATLALPVLALAYLLVSGRAAAYFARFFTSGRGAAPAPEAFRAAFTTAVVWIGATLPLVLCAWELGRQHTGARRRGYALLVGLREVWHHALGRAPSAARVDAFARAPRDNPRRAFALGGGVTVFVPAFFLAGAPPLRSAAGVVWLAGTGAIMGSLAYCHWRAAAYLIEEPGRWDPFRGWRLLSPSRYAPPGRPFVRWQRIGSVLLPVWWLGGGALVMSAASGVVR